MFQAAFRIITVAFILASCQQISSPKELIDRFYTNKADLDSLVKKIGNNKHLDSLFYSGPETGIPDIKDSYPNEFRLLTKIGITDASSHNTCYVCDRWYYLKTNWPSEYPIYLIYNNKQDSIENTKGFYKKDKYKNETWGLGGNWRMFRFVDTIRDIKF
ncbi:hypothetical protein ACQ33O_13505 [Ferruginibacter sp. SUN002]|uniref:hypothetical protein n=1 Tax=Ferruginibacter sp. SUN002 TaxID=2937789 RepID=UPI003D36AD5D